MGQPASVLAADVFSLGVTALIRALSQRPQPNNDTVRRMEAAMREKEEAERRKREAQDAERRAREERETAQRRQREAEESARRAREERDRAERKAKDEREEARRRAKEMEERAERERIVAEEQRREAEKARAAAEEAMKKANKAEFALKKGIKMVCSFTREEYEETRRRLDYREDKMHFAICGTSGSGKSSLINAFRGMSEYDEDTTGLPVAKTDIVECTSATGRYPDPRNEAPYNSFVWYDIPGAGTQSISDATYFTAQGLYLFDFIILVYADRFTSTDAAILRNCLRFGIPCFIVRSKADMHVENLFKAKMRARFDPRRMGHMEKYEELKEEYVSVTRRSLRRNLEELAAELRKNKREGEVEVDIEDAEIASLENMRVYIVTADQIRHLVSAGENEDDFVEQEEFIDEKDLVHDLLHTTIDRRGSSTAKLMAKAAKLSL